jgi:hypothetical protein
MHLDTGYKVKIARSFQELEEIRPFWENVQFHPNADIDFFLTILETRREILRPHVIVLYRDGFPKTILVGRIEDVPLQFEIGYKVIYKPIVRQLTIVYGGILGEISDSIGAALVKEVMDTLTRGEADVVFFNHLRVDSPIYHQAKKIPGFLWRDRLPAHTVHRRLKLPRTLDEFYRACSRNTRENIRRYSKNLLRTFGESITVKCFQNENEIGPLMKDIEEVAGKTYQRGLGVGLGDDDETRRKLLLGLQHQWLRLYLLYIQDKPCAFWPGYHYCKTFFIDIPGYDPKYRSYRLGHFLHMKMIEDLCENLDTEAVDYGFGDAQYKRSYSNESWREVSLYLYAPKLKSIKLNALRLLTVGTSQFAQTALNRAGLLTKVKRIWRERLTPKA